MRFDKWCNEEIAVFASDGEPLGSIYLMIGSDYEWWGYSSDNYIASSDELKTILHKLDELNKDQK